KVPQAHPAGARLREDEPRKVPRADPGARGASEVRPRARLAMRAMVFAAGLGTRLKPLSDVVPKPLVPVGPWPLVRYAIETVKAAGITEIAVNVSHLPEALPPV